MAPMYKVFLSSTSRDLEAYREAAHRAIDGLPGFQLVKMEDFGARDANAKDLCAAAGPGMRPAGRPDGPLLRQLPAGRNDLLHRARVPDRDGGGALPADVRRSRRLPDPGPAAGIRRFLRAPKAFPAGGHGRAGRGLVRRARTARERRHQGAIRLERGAAAARQPRGAGRGPGSVCNRRQSRSRRSARTPIGAWKRFGRRMRGGSSGARRWSRSSGRRSSPCTGAPRTARRRSAC